MSTVRTIAGWRLELCDATPDNGVDRDWLHLRHPDRPVEYHQAIDPGVLDWLLSRKDYTIRIYQEADGGHPLVILLPPPQPPHRPAEFSPPPFIWACGRNRFGDLHDILRHDQEDTHP